MYFELHMPYEASAEFDSEDRKGYYKTEKDYVDALDGEYISTNQDVYYYASRMDNNQERQNAYLQSVVGYNSGLGKRMDLAGVFRRSAAPEVVGYSKINVRLEDPDNNMPENVDSIVTRFAERRPYLIEFVMLSNSSDGRFEEEMKQWWIDSKAILEEGKKRGGAWIDQYIPKKTMKLSFLNKSNKRITFSLDDVEIEERVADRDYVLFVKSMSYIQ